MEKDYIFQSIDLADDIFVAAKIISKANLPVAQKLDLTPENAPTHPAFITPDSLFEQITDDREFFFLYASDKPVGTVGIEKSADDPHLYYIERLAVLPEAQQKGCGLALMNFACEKILEKAGTGASVAIINENKELKAWYKKQGFTETGIKKFQHLPFTVCFLKKELA